MIFVMDATIGQACESQVNNILVDLWFLRGTGPHATLMVCTYSVTICILTLLYHNYWYTVVYESVIFNLAMSFYLYVPFRPEHSKTKLMLLQLL